MCCFSGAVERVADTNIFARLTPRGTQVVAYAMTVASRADVAMILPLPVPPRSPENAVRFIDLSAYPTLFDDLRSAFPVAVSGEVSRGMTFGAAPQPARLAVHDVGAFEASFVPSLAEFGRLDPRFVLPRAVWDALPIEGDYGFAVFQLKGFSPSPADATPSREAPPAAVPGFWARLFGRRSGGSPAGAVGASGATQAFHPMAFELPMRRPGAIFFPTVHVHDGRVTPKAAFDHALYLQVASNRPFDVPGWERSERVAGAYVRPHDHQGVVDGDAVLHRREIRGMFDNRDIWVPVEAGDGGLAAGSTAA